MLVTLKRKVLSSRMQEHHFWLNESYGNIPATTLAVMRSKLDTLFNGARHERRVRARGFYKYLARNKCVTNYLLMMKAVQTGSAGMRVGVFATGLSAFELCHNLHASRQTCSRGALLS
jgi:hypothetical protein